MNPLEVWSAIFLGVVALSTLALAVGAGVAAVRVSRTAGRLEQAIAELQTDVRPLIARAAVVTEDAGRIAALVARQVERADALLADVSARLDEVVGLVETAIVRPVREVVGVLAALRAVVEALRSPRRRPEDGGRVEDEEALFIG